MPQKSKATDVAMSQASDFFMAPDADGKRSEGRARTRLEFDAGYD